jgi:exopolyphosphatase/guanosine-5'-triphosphate,3'-diphosphate pyrophosphatase
MLHDIGHFINTIDHDRHGHYLLIHHPLIGLTSAEQEIVANLVYYHRKQIPANDDILRNLLPKDRVVITKLVALLRLADALDTSHLGRVLDVSLEQVSPGQWRLYLHSTSEAMLEKWLLAKRKSLFQDVFGVKLEVK